MGMRADEQERIPVPAQRRLAFTRLGLNTHALARATVEAHQIAILGFRVDGVWIFGINAGLKAVALLSVEPIFIRDPVDAARLGRSPERGVILRAAINVIKGTLVI